MYSIIQLRNSIFLTILFLYTIFVRWSIRSSYEIFIRFVRVNDIVNIQKLNELYIYIYNIEGQFIHNLRCLKICQQGDLILLVNYAQMSATFQVLCGVQVMKMLIWCFEFSCLNFKLDIFVNCSYCSILFFSFLY